MLLEGTVRRIARKELILFFASPMAYLFFGSFTAVTLFVFFWGESFFSRNIADVRPMFEWMPILLIFLCSALTMRMWSEEKRSGTLEFVITLPVNAFQFVLGKFYACVALLAISLLLTLPIPISVSLISALDWGPVISAYLATLFLGAAYMSIGLYISAMTENQIVSLIVSTLVCTLLYMVGSDFITSLVGNNIGDILRQLGSGSRFESITRGVIDGRDIYYYLSVIVLFLALNMYVLEKMRWASDGDKDHHWRWRNLIFLVVCNTVLANVWLSSIAAVRIDTTDGKIYSISDVTKSYLKQLKEPLLIRGYFSSKTHPLLAPLVPQMRDLIQEYEIAGGGKVRAEFIDPLSDERLEEEAGTKYGVRPVALQVADRYSASMLNSYFNVVVQYGDEHEVMGFSDLIEVKVQGEGNADVKLRNPEYDITRSIKRVLYDYQAEGNLFENIPRQVTFTGYFSEEANLPPTILAFKPAIESVLAEFQKISVGKFTYNIINPEENGGVIAKEIAKTHGFRPMRANIFSPKPFYFYMVLDDGVQSVQVVLPVQFGEYEFEESLSTALKRFSPGMMKTVGAVAPIARAYSGGDNKFEHLHKLLGENLSVRTVDLESGAVPVNVDVLLLISPEDLEPHQLYGIDQFLMQGGTVVAATSPFTMDYGQDRLEAHEHVSGLEDWLSHHGIDIEKSLMMDAQNAPFPVPVARQAGGVTMQELKLMDYPFFVDVREDGFSKDSSITRGMSQVVMAWPSPINVDQEANRQRKVIELIHSSDKSWASTSQNITPTVQGSFMPSGAKGSRALSVSVEGQFDSYFTDKTMPLLESDSDEADLDDSTVELSISRRISQSPESARIVVFASNEFIDDQAIQLTGKALGTQYIKPLELVLNAIEWSLEDDGLAEIRGRSHFSRTLPPLEKADQQMIEYLNYGLALTSVGMVLFIQRARHKKRQKKLLLMLAEEEG